MEDERDRVAAAVAIKIGAGSRRLDRRGEGPASCSSWQEQQGVPGGCSPPGPPRPARGRDAARATRTGRGSAHVPPRAGEDARPGRRASDLPGRACAARAPHRTPAPAAVIASLASRRFETSLSGSCRRNTSIPLSAAVATNRRSKSPATGLLPDQEATAQGQRQRRLVRPRSARVDPVRSSTPRLTAESKHPPPETSSIREPRAVEDAGQVELGRGRASPRRAAPVRADEWSC